MRAPRVSWRVWESFRERLSLAQAELERVAARLEPPGCDCGADGCTPKGEPSEEYQRLSAVRDALGQLTAEAHRRRQASYDHQRQQPDPTHLEDE